MATADRDRSHAYLDSISIALGRLAPETEVSAQDGGWLAPLRFLEIRLIQGRSSCRFRDWNIPCWKGFFARTGSPRSKEGRGPSVAEDDLCQVLASLHHNGEKTPWFQRPHFAILEADALSSNAPCEARAGRGMVSPGDVVKAA